MRITSDSLAQNQPIPKKYTCDGDDLSPALTLSDIPPETQSIALVMDDPDAPHGTFDHWVVWDIPPIALTISEGQKFSSQGTNGFGSLGYRGPCPPRGSPHHYHFKVYALDVPKLNLSVGATKGQLEKAMQGHIVDEAALIGTYQRG